MMGGRRVSLTIEGMAAIGYHIVLHSTAPGNFGQYRHVTKTLPERFQTVEAAAQFGAEKFNLDAEQIKLPAC